MPRTSDEGYASVLIQVEGRDGSGAEHPSATASAPLLKLNHGFKASSLTYSTVLQHWPVLDPDESKLLNAWDIVMFVQLVIIAFLTPFEAAFLKPELGPLFYFDRLMDVVFTVDMLLELVTAYPDPQRPAHKVKVPRRIIQHYLGGWFWFDLFSILPFDAYCVVSKDQCAHGIMGDLHRLHILRLLRLVRLLRLTRLQKLVYRYNLYFGFSYAFLALLKFFALIVLCCHWMACFWGCLGSRPSRGHTWLTALREAKGGPDELYDGPLQVYSLALYWAIITLTSIGYGDITPQTMLEYRVATVCTSVMAGIWAYVIGAVCGIVSTMEPHEITFKQTMDDLNWLMSSRGMPHEMRLKLRRYFHETREMNRRRTESQITDQMSPMLQGEFSLFSHQKWIEKVWYLKNMPHDIIVFMSRNLKMSAYSPNEEVFSDRTLCIVRRGICALDGKILVSGHTWGEDMLLSNVNLRSKNHARSLSYSFLLMLHVEDMADIVAEFPEARARLKWAQVQIAIIRGVRKIAEVTRELERAGTIDLDSMNEAEKMNLFKDVLSGRIPDGSGTTPGSDNREALVSRRESTDRRRTGRVPTWHSMRPSFSAEELPTPRESPRREDDAASDAKLELLTRSLAAVNTKVDKLLASSNKAAPSRTRSIADLGPLVRSVIPEHPRRGKAPSRTSTDTDLGSRTCSDADLGSQST